MHNLFPPVSLCLLSQCSLLDFPHAWTLPTKRQPKGVFEELNAMNKMAGPRTA